MSSQTDKSYSCCLLELLTQTTLDDAASSSSVIEADSDSAVNVHSVEYTLLYIQKSNLMSSNLMSLKHKEWSVIKAELSNAQKLMGEEANPKHLWVGMSPTAAEKLP